jgi:hypothetical protein
MTTHIIRYTMLGALAVGLVLPMASAARADVAADCRARLQTAKDRIDRDAAKYGEHSAKVDHDVAKLEEARQWCRDHKAEWDHNVFDVGIYVHH